MNEELREIVSRNRCTTSSIREMSRKLSQEKQINEMFIAFDILRYCRHKNGGHLPGNKRKSKNKF